MKPYGLIGEKLSHSFSKKIHNYLSDYTYNLYPLPPEKVKDFLASGDFSGLNVTIPYKKTVIPYLKDLSDTAKRLCSVNTITVDRNGSLRGHNTDYYGFYALLQKENIKIEGKKAIILGSGGAAQTVIAVLEDLKAKSVTVISRNGENNYSNIALHADAEVIVNTTPVGMYPDNEKSPVDINIFKNCKFVVDLIYNPAKTQLLLEAEKRGIRAANGLYMLVAQAKKACELFTGKDIEDGKIDEIARLIEKKMKNIILVGMPGSGKSTIGKELAQRLDREFLDTDAIIESKFGKSPAEIITSKGEEYFRKLESEVAREVGKLCGKVIATGGGIVLKEENRMSLKQNAFILFLNRSPERLETQGRPLSKNLNALIEMAGKRNPLYREICDFEIDCNKDLHTVIAEAESVLSI